VVVVRRSKRVISTFRAQDADVTVFSPRSAPPGSKILIQVMVHAIELKPEAHARALKIEPSAEELASTPLTIQLNQNDNIKVSLDCEGTEISEPVQNANWNGRIVCFYFMMQLPASRSELIVSPRLRVFVNAVPAGFVVFKIKVQPNSSPDFPLVVAEQEGRAFKSAFLSYASEDRVEVLKAAQLIKALRMQFFQDVLSASAGDYWRERLFSEIEKCDVFLLFWSKHARASDWVIREAEYALRCSKSAPPDRSLEIIPVLLEGPPPPLPPPSLQEIHFNDPIRYVIFAEESISTKGSVYRPPPFRKRASQRPISEADAISALSQLRKEHHPQFGKLSERMKKFIHYAILLIIVCLALGAFIWNIFD
jgi:hypothetical protein